MNHNKKFYKGEMENKKWEKVNQKRRDHWTTMEGTNTSMGWLLHSRSSRNETGCREKKNEGVVVAKVTQRPIGCIM